MLNISNNKVFKSIVDGNYKTLVNVENKKSNKVLRRILISFFFVLVVVLFLPWTQSIRSNGYVTTLRPDQKPQNLNSIIAGQVEAWFVQEGDFVNKGDTILRISEVKAEYFDDKLLERTKNQVALKKESVGNYANKVRIQEQQLNVLKEALNLKLQQAQNKLSQAVLKVQNDSINYETAIVNFTVAKNQYSRTENLFKQGLKSKVDLEKKRIKLQQTEGYTVEKENKWLNAKNEVRNLSIELNNISVKYQTDVNKLQSEKNSTIAQKLDVETNLNKLENTYSNYLFRNGLYYIIAPQAGYITKTFTSGIGETIKEGQEILTLMPRDYDLAIELYVEPLDLPLVQMGEKVRIQFDGWPAIVFNGWPNASQGTYGGEIYAIDQFISANGKFRVLVKPDVEDHAWPDALRYGSGTSNLIMLNDVSIWYELWRNINGFPPQYYDGKDKIELKKNKK